MAAALEPPVVDAGAVALWAGFLSLVRADPAMAAIHERTYRDFRDRLEAWLIRQHRRGVLEVPDPELAARLLPEMVRGGFQIEILAGRRGAVSDEELRDHVERSVDFALRALCRRAEDR